MLKRVRLLLGISIFWLALSMLFDGLNTLVLPNQLAFLVPENRQASVLGVLTFTGLLAGMLVQPLAGTISDRTRSHWGRLGFIGIGTALILISLAIFGLVPGLFGVIVGYMALQVSASTAQAGQQGFIPDLVPAKQRGTASGWKGFMDIGGAMLGFIVLGQLLGSGQTKMALAVIAAALVGMYLFAVLLTGQDRSSGRKSQSLIAPSPRSNPLVDAFRLDVRQHRPFAWLVLSRFLFLLGTYAVGRFLLYFVAERLGLSASEAAEEAGRLLAGLALVTILAAPLMGWAADRLGRIPIMVAGGVFNAAGMLLLMTASQAGEMLLFGSLMSLGSAAFASANWAMTADLVPISEPARFFGIANYGTAGAAACAGLFGALVDGANRLSPGSGYPVLFIAAAMASLASILALVEVKRSLARASYQAAGSPECAEKTLIE